MSVAPTSAFILAPRLLLWAVGAPQSRLNRSLQSLLERPAYWSGIEIFADVGIKQDLVAEGPNLRWHHGVQTQEAAFAAMSVPPDVPLAWLLAGTLTCGDWVRPLLVALQREPSLGSCSPLALGSAQHSPLFEDDRRVPDLTALNGWLQAHAGETAVDLGRPLAAAGLLRHAAWQAVCREQGSPWFLTVARAGWVHGSSRQVCVALSDEPGVRSEDCSPSLTLLAEEGLWRAAHPLTGLRHALSEVPALDLQASAAERTPVATEKPSAPKSPVRLHVMHSWGGGLGKWVRDFCKADAQTGRGRGLLLKSIGVYGAFGQRLELHADHDGGTPLAVWELGLPIHATALVHLQVQQILDEVIERYGVSQVLVSSLIGHSLDVLRTGLPTVMVLHDHHPFCVTLYAQFEGECRQCDRQRLGRCMQENPSHRFFEGVRAEDWQALREAFVHTLLCHRPLLAAPSTSVAQRWLSFMPALQSLPIRVIEHGLEMPDVPTFEAPEDGPLRVVVLGRLSAEKGRGLLAEILPGLSGWAEVLLLGCGEQADEIKALPHVKAVAHFDHSELGVEIARWRPHVGLLTSTVPETFSYTLSELWHCRVPVLACALGALADRIRDGHNGFLEMPSAPALLARLRALHDQREPLKRVRQSLHAQATRGLADMLQDYAQALDARPRLRPTNALATGPVTALRAFTDPAPQGASRWLQVNPEATWLQAARGFWAYTKRKAAHSPRLPLILRHWLRD